MSPEIIPADTTQECLTCAKKGSPVLSGMRDFFLGHEGLFAFWRCRDCGLFWLSPRPSPDAIGLYYRGYYTHAPAPAPSAIGGPGRFLGSCRDAVRQAILGGYYGYSQAGDAPIRLALGRLLGRIRPLRLRATADLKELLPRRSPGGTILDIGCGRGDFLARMQALGWNAVGIEPDPVAARLAEDRGIRIVSSAAFEASLPPGSIDHIAMNHALEHVHQPIALLKKCREWLKPSGTLALYTPNANSLGRRFFGCDWSAFDPPRHFFVFSKASLRLALRQAGFRSMRIYSFARLAPQIYDASRAVQAGTLRCGTEPSPAGGLVIFSLAEKILCGLGLGCGEELAAIASP